MKDGQKIPFRGESHQVGIGVDAALLVDNGGWIP